MADHGDNGHVAVLADCDGAWPEVLNTPDITKALHTNLGFAPKVHGHSTLSDMAHCYPDLVLTQGQGNGSWVRLEPSVEHTKVGSS